MYKLEKKLPLFTEDTFVSIGNMTELTKKKKIPY